MFTVLGALIGAIIDIAILLALAVTIISVPFIAIGWIAGKVSNAFHNAKN